MIGIESFQELEAIAMAKTENEAISRRTFVRQTGLAAGAAVLGAQTAASAPPARPTAAH